MNLSLPLHGSRMQLMNQLVYFDEEKTNFLNAYFPNSGREREHIDEMLSAYTETLEHILANFNEEALHSAVLIGSRIEIRYLDDDTLDRYSIVFPTEADVDVNKISILSPLGFQLLLTKVNEKYEFHIPSGPVKIRVEGIQYMNCGDASEW